nr:hypothetical protein [Tanacetum cinerariifolium]
MDANKKMDLDNPLCPNESKILANILQNHPLRFSIDASSSVPWIYLGLFWHTLKEDGSNYRLSFMLDMIELTLTLDDFMTIFQLPQATNNNHEPFIMQMFYCFINNMHVDYADLLWERLHYSLEHPSTPIPYPRFTKLIVSHYMTAFFEISRKAHDKYHNLEDDMMVKNIFNLGKHKDGVRMKIPNVPTTHSQLIESTQGMHRITRAPRSPNPAANEGESTLHPRDQDDAHPEGENDAKRQKTFEHGTYVFRESSSDDDEIPIEKVSQELMDEMSQIVDEAKLHKERILVLPHPQKPTPVVQSCQRDPKAPALSMVNQDLLYLKKGSSGPEKIVMSLYKFHAVIFPDDDIKERTSRWKVNLTAPTITLPCIEKYKVFLSISELVYGIIYKNRKKEKRVMRHQEIYKFCDATLKRVLDGLKSYNNNVKHGYVTPSLSNEDVEYLQLFEEEIKERLKHHDQMRHWEMYVNRRPLRSRRERPE